MGQVKHIKYFTLYQLSDVGLRKHNYLNNLPFMCELSDMFALSQFRFPYALTYLNLNIQQSPSSLVFFSGPNHESCH